MIKIQMKDLHSTKQLTPEQFGPGLVSTSCISLEETSAVLAEELSDVRIAVAAMRTTAGLVTACCLWQFLSFLALKMDKTLTRKLSNQIYLKSEEVICSISSIRPELHSTKFIVNQKCSNDVIISMLIQFGVAYQIRCAASLLLTHMRS